MESYRWWLPRISGNVMLDLRIWMLGFGLLTGLVFPFLVIGLGVSHEAALQPAFFAATVAAGLGVAEINHFLVRVVVGVRLRSLVDGMAHVEALLVDASVSGDWAGCDPEACMVTADSADEFGDVAHSFNGLVAGLSSSHQVSDGIKKVSYALAAHLEMGSLAEVALRELSGQTACDAAALLTVNNGKVVVAGSMRMRDGGDLAGAEIVLSVLHSAQPAVLRLPQDLVAIGQLTEFVHEEVHIRPVLFGTVTVGVLVLAFAEPSSAAARAVLGASLPGFAVAVNNALTHEDLQRVAALDPLTGVFNRRSGLVRLAEEFERARQSHESLGVLMFDIDHFKAVNDTFGHLVGDRVLRSLVQTVREVLRDADVLLRFGGEEFVVVSPRASRVDLAFMGERIRRAVAEAGFIEDGLPNHLTVSVGGFACHPGSSTTPQEMIGHADLALYASKNSGRDRCMIA
ncbi:GGDEF domain-containing protein [Arthrobacter sp. H20]|uniref:GGDEF domain-containing protein n=1 Tax=Arthrobacter sp. H20 TaxID=1267981 RepID=UPI0004B8B9CE|nr:GGDEF domain-containing protein [Arthrobacter sp. H20]